jgi:putative MATE family efflux protein
MILISKEQDLLNGNLLKKIVVFAIPVMLSGVLQLLFNACDLMVVGKFSGDDSLAAVGSTSALTSLLVNLFIGVSVGANVSVARAIGRKNKERCHDVVHTAILFSIIAGLFLTIFGVLTARFWLIKLDTNEDVLDKATTYLGIYFAGSIFNLLYNFGASIIRATGETKKPLYFLVVAGIANVLLNLIFVIVFNMDVAGVALATIISQMISSVLIIIYLMKADGYIHFNIKELKIDKSSFGEMVLIGLPAGIQSSLFSISNVSIQKAINSFNSTAIIAGNSASNNIGGFIYTSMNSFYQACITFTSQNMGAKKIKNCKKVLLYSLLCVTVTGFVIGGVAVIFGRPLLGLYANGDEAIKYGMIRLTMIGMTYFLCGIGDVFVGGLRGLGYSIIPMINSIIGICGLRLVWIYTVFKHKHTLETLYVSYPLSWIITAIIHLVCYCGAYKILTNKVNKQQ